MVTKTNTRDDDASDEVVDIPNLVSLRDQQAHFSEELPLGKLIG